MNLEKRKERIRILPEGLAENDRVNKEKYDVCLQ